jgi:signal transduction histidine kinase
MRLGIKSALLLVTGYALLVVGFAVGVEHWLRGFEASVVRQTARLLAGEVAALLSERSVSALLEGDRESRALLHDRIEDLVLLSHVVSSITVVDREGGVVASDQWPVRHQLAKPGALFAGGAMDVVRAREPAFLEGGDFLVDLPLQQEGRLIGYLEVSLRDERLAGLYGEARKRLLVLAIAGLLGVLVLGALLQLQIARQAATIANALEGALEPPNRERRLGLEDEFGRALQAAGRVRRALNEARRESSRLHLGFGALAQVMKMGVVLLRGDREVDFANDRAMELLSAASLAELRGLWTEKASSLLDPLLARLSSDGDRGLPAHLELPGKGGTRRLRVELYRLGGEERDEYIVLLNDPEILDALETDVRLASQLEGLARVYRTAAHELRAPLSAMMINLDLLRESLSGGGDAPELKDSQERYVGVLREELERLNRSLSQVMTEALPPTGRRDRFDLREALGELGALLAGQARRQGVELATRVPPEPVVLLGYRDRLKQAFLNVAVNALEAMPNGGRMGIVMETEEGLVRVTLADSGPGIPAELLSRIYEREFTTKGGGSGIGLYVARALVELHGGRIRVDSQVGRGTRVEVALPVAPGD